MKKLVILGGGYGGLTLAVNLLEKSLPPDIEIELIDRQPYQGLKTEYYALAAGTVPEAHIRVAFPIDSRIRLRYGEVKSVNLDNKQVEMTHDEPIAYDWLAIALGCVDKYHGIVGAEDYSHSIQTMSSCRKAYQAINDLKPYGQVTIVGGGLSGVELASELRESRSDLNIRILDRGSSILSAFPGKLQHYVKEWFEEHEVNMIPHVSVSRVEQGVLYNRDEPIETDITVWTAGIQPSPIVQQMDLPKDSSGRLVVNEFHQLPAFPEVYVIGDCSSMPFSPSAQLAEAQGKQVAEVLTAIWANEQPKLKPIKLKGILGSLGKKSGFGVMGERTIMMGKVPRMLKSGVLWMSKHHWG